jgi:hypothetical protein
MSQSFVDLTANLLLFASYSFSFIISLFILFSFISSFSFLFLLLLEFVVHYHLLCSFMVKLEFSCFHLSHLGVANKTMLQWNRSLICALDIDFLLFGPANPLRKLHIIWDSCRKHYDTNMIWKFNDNLFPDTSSFFIVDIMNLIEYDPLHILKIVHIVIKLTLKHLCCHDNTGCVSVDADISCQYSNIFFAKLLFEVSEFLI